MPRLYAMTLPLSTYNMLDFNNTEIAFSSKSRGELQNAYWLFNTIKYPWLVKCAKVATSIALKIHFPLAWAVKPTLYKQFVGGETLQDCSAAINHLMKYNVKSTLDYSAESEQTPEGIQATFEETLRKEIRIWPMPYSNHPRSRLMSYWPKLPRNGKSLR